MYQVYQIHCTRTEAKNVVSIKHIVIEIEIKELLYIVKVGVGSRPTGGFRLRYLTQVARQGDVFSPGVRSINPKVNPKYPWVRVPRYLVHHQHHRLVCSFNLDTLFHNMD